MRILLSGAAALIIVAGAFFGGTLAAGPGADGNGLDIPEMSSDDVGNPYGEDDLASQSSPTVTNDGSDAVVAEMRRQEQRRRADEQMQRGREAADARRDAYNAQLPPGYIPSVN